MTNLTLTSDLSGLLGRVEEATGADRELDALIMCALVAAPGAHVEQSKINGAWCIFDGVDRSGRPRLWERRGLPHRPDGWPLTASLDASLALCERVLPGHRPMFWQDISDDEWGAHFRAPDTETCYAKTPALALLAAMLKALIAQGEAGTAEPLSRSGRK